MKKNLCLNKILCFLLFSSVLLGFASCGRVTVLSESSRQNTDREQHSREPLAKEQFHGTQSGSQHFGSQRSDGQRSGSQRSGSQRSGSQRSDGSPTSWAASESLGDQQVSHYRPQVWHEPTTAETISGDDEADHTPAMRPSRTRRSRVDRIWRKDPFGERYAQANQISVGVHNLSPGQQRGAVSASSIMEAAPAPALAQARQRYDFNDPLYLALFIILVVLALLLAILIIAETISALGLIGVLLLAALIIALVILL
jgi:hypothetical protein